MKTLPAIEINSDLTYHAPAPRDITEVFFGNRPKAEQHWPLTEDALRRELDIPPLLFQWSENTKVSQEYTQLVDGELLSLSIEDTDKLVAIRDRELIRRQEGIHFWNNGEIVYIDGNMYFFLVYYIIPETGHPGYREYQRDVFYVIDLAKKNPDCLGAFFAKAKKTGLSHVMAAVYLNEATMIRNRMFGVMNKTQDECNKLNMNFIFLGLNELPPIFQPRFSDKSASMIKFNQPSVKNTGSKHMIEKAALQRKNRALNTWISSAATKEEVAFDGPAMYFVHLDEFPKWEKVSQEAFFDKVSETVKIQQTIRGKIWITSYPPEKDGKNFEESKVIYYNSKLSTIKEGGRRTASGLICHFVGALDSTDGTFDIYGKADRALALKKNQEERDLQKTKKAKQNKIRQYPRTEEECWRSGGAGSTFDNEHLAEAITNLDMIEAGGKEVSQMGVMKWNTGLMRDGASFVRLTKKELQKPADGSKEKPLAICNMYEPYPANLYNRCVQDDEGNWMPPVDTHFIMAVDTTEYKPKNEVDKAPSDWSITVMNFPDSARDTLLKRTATGVIVFDYHNRQDDPMDDLDFTIMCAFMFSCYMLIEANKQWALTEIKKRKLHKFLLLLQTDGSIAPYTEGDQNKNLTSTARVIEEYCRRISMYLSRPTGNRHIDYCLLLRNRKTILMLMRFDPSNTKEFDPVVSLGLCLMAMAAFDVLREDLKKRHRRLDNMAELAEFVCSLN